MCAESNSGRTENGDGCRMLLNRIVKPARRWAGTAKRHRSTREPFSLRSARSSISGENGRARSLDCHEKWPLSVLARGAGNGKRPRRSNCAAGVP
jgi:hypothetical protein